MSQSNKTSPTKQVEMTILELVHCYFYFFHAWIPTNKCERLLLISLRYYQWISLSIIILFQIFSLANLYSSFSANVSDTAYVVVIIVLTLQFLLCIAGFYFLSPNKPLSIMNRLKSNYPDIQINERASSNENKYLQRYELEKVWIEYFINNIDLSNLIQKIERNMSNRRPTSRDPELAIINILRNPYIVNSMVIVFTVLLTIALNPISESISDDNFVQFLGNSLIFGLIIWFLIVVILLAIKVFFFVTFSSFEYTSKHKQLVLWRYEVFIDMLARHEKVIATKPIVSSKD